MTHLEFLQTSELIDLHAVKNDSKAVYFTDKCSGVGYAEINGGTWHCHSMEEFEELVESVGDEEFYDDF